MSYETRTFKGNYQVGSFKDCLILANEWEWIPMIENCIKFTLQFLEGKHVWWSFFSLIQRCIINHLPRSNTLFIFSSSVTCHGYYRPLHTYCVVLISKLIYRRILTSSTKTSLSHKVFLHYILIEFLCKDKSHSWCK